MPSGSEWAYEIKHDGFRFLAVRQRKQVRIYSRGVTTGPSGCRRSPRRCGRSLFARGAPEAFLYAFDVLELDGQDMRRRPLAGRREALERLLVAAGDGIRLCEHIEDVDGAVVFRQACVMGLEGIVAKRRDSRYRSGRCREWIKIKNSAHPAIERAMLVALSKRARR